MKEILNQISIDIKNCELFLLNYPITRNRIFKCEAGLQLKWDNNTKSIWLCSDSKEKKLIEFDVAERCRGYHFLINFMFYCTQEEEKDFDVEDIKDVHEKIEKFLTKK